MKNITKVISSIFGVVSAIAGISSLTGCTEVSDTPATDYGPPSAYDACANANIDDCVKCCNQADDVEVCIEDYIKNGFCSDEPAVEYGPPVTDKYGPIAP